MLLQNKRYDKFVYAGLLAIFILSIGLLGWYGYNWYKVNRAQEAYQAFSESVAEFDQAKSGNKDITWAEVVSSLKVGAKKYSDTSLYPFFLAYESQALKLANDQENSQKVLSQSIESMPKDNPLYGLYAIKNAVLRLNSDKDEAKQEGISLLEDLAKNKNLSIRQTALYYLGYYFYLSNNIDKANQYWLELYKTGIKDTVWQELVSKYLPALDY